MISVDIGIKLVDNGRMKLVDNGRVKLVDGEFRSWLLRSRLSLALHLLYIIVNNSARNCK